MASCQINANQFVIFIFKWKPMKWVWERWPKRSGRFGGHRFEIAINFMFVLLISLFICYLGQLSIDSECRFISVVDYISKCLVDDIEQQQSQWSKWELTTGHSQLTFSNVNCDEWIKCLSKSYHSRSNLLYFEIKDVIHIGNWVNSQVLDKYLYLLINIKIMNGTEKITQVFKSK